MNQYNEFMQNIETKTIEEMIEMADALEAIQHQESAISICPNHPLELYLFEYWCKTTEYKVSKYRIHEVYLRIGNVYVDKKEYEEAEEAYLKALQWNPTDLEVYHAMCDCYYKQQDWYALKEVVDKMYPFIFSKSDMAAYYRYMGCYYLEIYEPQTAAVLYQYSNLYSESKWAKNELKFIEKALGKKVPLQKPDELQQNLKERGIPLQPNERTLAMLYQAVLDAKEIGNTELATQYATMLFELTGEE